VGSLVRAVGLGALSVSAGFRRRILNRSVDAALHEGS
jgi:hypothetical protein